MRKLINLGFIPILFLVGCNSSEVFFKDALCIENISTVDPVDGLKENQTVIIKSGKIHKIASTDELKLSHENEIIEGSGKYMIPGLWDSHMHFAYIEELAPRMFDLFLAYGITSVRDTGGEITFVKKWKDKALANPTNAPRVMIAGPLLDGMPNVYDGSNPGRPPLSVGLNSVEAVVKQVNALEKAGVDFLKAYEMLTPEQFAMVIKLGREKGLKIAGHVPLSIDVVIASNAGLNSMEHMRNLELSCASNADELLEQRRQFMKDGKEDPGGVLRSRIHKAQREIAIRNYDESKANEVLSVLARNHTWQIPTLTLNTASTEMPYNQKEWQESIWYLPDSIGRQWKKNADSMMSRKSSPFRQQYSQWQFDMVRKIHHAKIDIMAGTDCPITYLTPGYSLHQELTMLVKAGLSPLEVLKSATLNPARYFNLENELGSIKEELWADLVILDANPLENINNTRLINAVVKHGKYLSRNDLDQILDRLSKE